MPLKGTFVENQSIAYYVGYYGASILVALCLLAAIIWVCKAIWKLIQRKE